MLLARLGDIVDDDEEDEEEGEGEEEDEGAALEEAEAESETIAAKVAPGLVYTGVVELLAAGKLADKILVMDASTFARSWNLRSDGTERLISENAALVSQFFLSLGIPVRIYGAISNQANEAHQLSSLLAHNVDATAMREWDGVITEEEKASGKTTRGKSSCTAMVMLAFLSLTNISFLLFFLYSNRRIRQGGPPLPPGPQPPLCAPNWP